MVSFLIEENEQIRKFFEGDDSCIPISEYMYLHTRPLLRPTFLTQINDVGELLEVKLTGKKPGQGVIDKLSALAIRMGKNMEGDITEDKAREILLALREYYNLAQDLLRKFK